MLGSAILEFLKKYYEIIYLFAKKYVVIWTTKIINDRGDIVLKHCRLS